MSLNSLLFRCCFVVTIILEGSAHTWCQKDSLWNVWNTQQNPDTTRLNALTKLIGTYYCRQDPDSAILLAQLQIDLATKTGNNISLAEAWSNIGAAHDTKGEHRESFDSQAKAVEYRKHTDDRINLARNYSNMGTAARYMGQFAKALECHQHAFDIHQQLGNRQGLAASYSAMGNVYLAQGYRSANDAARNESNQKALEYFTKAYELGKELGEMKLMAMALNNTALVYHEMGRIQDSKVTHEKVLEMSISMKNVAYQSNALNNLGVSYEALGDSVSSSLERDSLWQLALKYYLESYDIRKSLGQLDLMTNSMTNIASLKRRIAWDGPESLRKVRLAEAAQWAEECFALTNETENLSERNHVALALSEIYKDQGKYKEAYDAYEIYVATKDSINSEDQRSELLRQEMTYDFEKKELEKSRQYEQELLQQRNQRNMLFAGGALLLLVIIFLVNGLRVRRNAAKILANKNAQVEAARAQAERSEQAKQSFLANMSHEIRTPMNAISGLSRLLLDKNHDEQTKEYLIAIQRSSENLTVVLNDILDQAKIDAGKMDIRPVVMDLYEELRVLMRIWSARAQEKGLETSLEMDQNLPPFVKLDPARFSQILSNLLGNAIKFTEVGKVSLLARMESDQLIFEVVDTGSGIPAAELDLIFESFKQSEQPQARSKGGTGLGLSIARQLAGLMQGKLEAKSEEGKGSVFTLSIPSIIASRTELKQEVSFEANEHVIHVLVAEDNDYNYIVTQDTLIKYFPNANIIRAHHGQEAVNAIEDDDYDLIFMDVHMPVMDGYAATKKIRSINPVIPILGLTASVLNSDISKCQEAGMNGYIPKPFSEKEFISAMSSVLNLKIYEVQSDLDEAHEKKLFLQIIPSKLEALKRALDESDLTAIFELAHTLKPQLLNNNLPTLADYCELIQSKQSKEPLEIAKKLHQGLAVALEHRMK